MTWRLRPDSPNTLRLIRVLADATKPMTREELAEALGLSAQGLRRHLSDARHSGGAVLIGASSAARWVSPVSAAAAQANYDAISSTRKYPPQETGDTARPVALGPADPGRVDRVGCRRGAWAEQRVRAGRRGHWGPGMSTDWNTRMLAVASVVAGWSKDPSTQVGAVIADGSHRIVSQGYNGLARGVTDDPDVLADRDEKLRRTIHAEMNAVLFADRRSLMGCTIYVTHPPCARCAAVLIQVGIARVVHSDRVLGPHWAADLTSARSMFAEAGVHIDCIQ